MRYYLNTINFYSCTDNEPRLDGRECVRPSSDNRKSRREWSRLQATTVPGTARNTRQLWLVVDNATYESQSDIKALVASFPTRPLGSDPVSTYTQNGDVLFQLEHYEEALTTYEQVLQLDPANSYAANCSGNALQARSL